MAQPSWLRGREFFLAFAPARATSGKSPARRPFSGTTKSARTMVTAGATAPAEVFVDSSPSPVLDVDVAVFAEFLLFSLNPKP